MKRLYGPQTAKYESKLRVSTETRPLDDEASDSEQPLPRGPAVGRRSSGYDSVMFTPPGFRPAAVKDVQATNGLHKVWWGGLSGFAFRFEEELRELHPNASDIDWTSVMQWVLSLPSSTEFLKSEKRLIFAAFVNLFVETARPFVQKIIDESFLEESQRTIKPDLQFGGVAGGAKYRKGMQLFKFAQDVELRPGVWLYGGAAKSHRMAMKSAGHEIKATQAIIDADIPELNCPMMAVFTYRQRRVTCVSLLPISGRDTLVQGTDTAALVQVRVPPPQVADVISTLARSLNLGWNSREGIYGPFDMEVHHGTDGRLYVIDAARLCPPEYRGPESVGPNLFYNLLRPELLPLVDRPLVADAFQVEDPEALGDLIHASRVLDEQIRNLAHELRQGLHAELLASRAHVKTLLHRRGINMRHLEYLCAQLLEQDSVCTLLSAARSQQPKLAEEMSVKTLRLPHERDIAELERVLKLQDASLKGPSRLRLVPTLLSMGDRQRDSIPIGLIGLGKEMLVGEFTMYSVTGSHPYVRAFQICEESDPLFKRTGTRVIDCSPITAITIVALRNLMSVTGLSSKKLLYPGIAQVVLENQRLLADMKGWHVVDRFLRSMSYNPGNQLRSAMIMAGNDGRWQVVEDLAQRYNHLGGPGFALEVAAQLGNFAYLRKNMRPSSSIPSIFWTAAQGGQDDVCVFLLGILDSWLPGDESILGRALVRAAASNHSSTVCLLLDHGANLSFEDTLFEDWCVSPSFSFCTALVVAAAHGHCDVLRLIFERDSAGTRSQWLYDEAICVAAVRGHVEAVRLLVTFGVDVNLAIGRKVPINAMCYAATRGLTKVMQVLVDVKADVNYRTRKNYWTPLMFACFEGNIHAVKFLVDNKADVNYRLPNDSSSSALVQAESMSHPQVVQFLRDCGAV